jgi:hypothetical protein
MTLKETIQSASMEINQNAPGTKMGPDRINLALKLTNYDYFKLWIGPPEDWQPGQPISRRGWQISKQNTEALKTFLVSNTNYTPNSTTGQLAYPSGFVSLSRVGYFNSITGRQRSIEPITDSEVDDRLGNPITPPTKEYPIVCYYAGYLQFYPVDLLNINMSYIRLPVTPKYVVKQENGIDVYDSANSVEFEWPERFHSDLLRMLIGYLAPSLKDAELTQFNEAKKQVGV